MFDRKGRAVRKKQWLKTQFHLNSTLWQKKKCFLPGRLNLIRISLTVVAQEGDVEIVTDGDEPQSVPNKVTQEPV